MDLQYGIAVTNKYSIFADEEEDPFEILRQKEEAKNQKKDGGDKKSKTKQSKKTTAVTENKVKAEPSPPKKEEKPNQPRQNDRGSARGGRGGRELRENDGSRPPRRQGPRENRDLKGDDENVPPESRERPEGGNRRERREGGFDRKEGGFDRKEGGFDRKEGGFERKEGGFDRKEGGFDRKEGGFDRKEGGFERREGGYEREGFERGRGRGGRGRGRGRGGPRPEGGRGGFGGPGVRRREFDRHSGTDKTGVKPVDKREGSGAHNWGSYKDDVEEQGQTQNQAEESTDWANSPAENTETPALNESGEGDVPKEEENKEMTLDEWKALQEQHRMKLTYNLRKAGEGVDNAQWKKGVAYQKKPEAGEEEEESEEEDEDEDRHGHRKQLLTDIRITFSDNPRRGGRGGRRGGRAPGGRGGRGAGRGFGGSDRSPRNPKEAAPRMDDETDFPRLVKSEA